MKLPEFVVHAMAATVALTLSLGLGGCKKPENEADTAKSDRRATLMVAAESAPPLRLKTLDGEYRFDGPGKRPVLLNFFSSWCKPCNNEAPVLQKAYLEFKGRVDFAGIAVQDSDEGVRGYVKDYGILYPVGLDADGRISADYRIYGIPKTIVVGKDGKVAFMYTGEVTQEMLEKELKGVL